MESIISHPMWPFWSTFVATILGAFISWVAAYIFYVKSSKELTEKTEVLRQINNAMASYLENCWGQDNVKFRRDSDGNVTGVEEFQHMMLPTIEGIRTAW